MTKAEIKHQIKEKLKGKAIPPATQAQMIDLVIELAEEFVEINEILKQINQHFPVVMKAAQEASKLRSKAKQERDGKEETKA